jgi:hypothetical protein
MASTASVTTSRRGASPEIGRGPRVAAKERAATHGHSSIVITLDLYGHLFPRGNDRAELEAAEAALWG